MIYNHGERAEQIKKMRAVSHAFYGQAVRVEDGRVRVRKQVEAS